MSKKLEFIFDFGSPNAYLAYHALGGVLERTGAELIIIPALLGGIFKSTNNQPPMMAFADVKGKMEYEKTETKRFIAKHGLTGYKLNPHFPVNTLILMRAAMVVEKEGRIIEYVEAGLKYMWEDGLNMAEGEIFADAMTKAGFDGKALLEATQKDGVKSALMERTAAVVARGVFGIPTFFVGNEMFFGKERLAQIEEELAK